MSLSSASVGPARYRLLPATFIWDSGCYRFRKFFAAYALKDNSPDLKEAEARPICRSFPKEDPVETGILEQPWRSRFAHDDT